MRYPFIILSCLCFLLISCKEDSVTPKVDQKPPRGSDSTWTYYLFRPVIDTFKVDFMGTMKITYEGMEYTVLKETQLDIPLGLFFLSWTGPDGLYNMGLYDSTASLYTKILKYKYPTHAGDAYEYREIIDGPDDSFVVSNKILTMKVIAVDTLITTPAGTLKCNQYQYTQRPVDDVADYWQFNHFYAPGVGLIRVKTISTKNNTITLDYSLIKREHH